MSTSQRSTLQPSFIGSIEFTGAAFKVFEQPFPIPLDSALFKHLAISFDLGVTTDPTTGRALNPIIPYTNAPEGLLTTLTIAYSSIPGFGSLQLMHYRNETPGPWVDNEILTEDYALADQSTLATSGGAPVSHVFSIDHAENMDSYAITDAPPTSSGSTRSTVQVVTSGASWDGYMSFYLKGSAFSGSVSVTSATLAVSYVPFNTGWLHHHADEGRPVLDGITGFPTFVPELQEHGYYDGIWCTDAAWDPDDPRDVRGTVELPDTEGEIGDDIPALK